MVDMVLHQRWNDVSMTVIGYVFPDCDHLLVSSCLLSMDQVIVCKVICLHALKPELLKSFKWCSLWRWKRFTCLRDADGWISIRICPQAPYGWTCSKVNIRQMWVRHNRDVFTCNAKKQISCHVCVYWLHPVPSVWITKGIVRSRLSYRWKLTIPCGRVQAQGWRMYSVSDGSHMDTSPSVCVCVCVSVTRSVRVQQ